METTPQRIGDYEVQRRIGAGGMGEVFAAVDTKIGKPVAIKVMRPELAATPGIPEQLLAEARAVNAVRHRNLIDVFGYGTLPDGRPYLVMELLDGLSLDSVIAEKKRLEVEEGIAVLAELLDALEAVHSAGLVHCDIKPGNVFVVTPTHGEPYVKLLDFGLSHRTAVAAEGPLAGTPQYMAPEQLRTEPATAASDVFALGALAYKAYTGAPPYPGASFLEVAQLQQKGPPAPLAQLNPAMPVLLGELVGRMLSTDPAERPSAAQALAEVKKLLTLVRPAMPVTKAEEITEVEPEVGFFAKLFGRKSKPAPKPKAPAVQKSAKKSKDVGAIDLLCLEDFDPMDHAAMTPLTAEEIAELVAKAQEQVQAGGRLPAFPTIALRVVQLADQGDTGANELVRLINQDPSLTAHVLRMANSAFANRGIEITSARDAVTRLGFREVANLAAAAATKAIFKVNLGTAGEVVNAAQQRVWMHALTSALGSSWLAMETRGDGQKAFLGGMLHDIGKTLALRAFAELRTAGKLTEVDPRRALPPLLQAVHVELGVRMAEEWKLPAHVARVCAEHHAPKASVKDDRELHIVRVVSGIAEMRLEPSWPFERMNEVQESATALGMDRFKLRAASTQVREFAAKAEALAKAAN